MYGSDVTIDWAPCAAFLAVLRSSRYARTTPTSISNWMPEASGTLSHTRQPDTRTPRRSGNLRIPLCGDLKDDLVLTFWTNCIEPQSDVRERSPMSAAAAVSDNIRRGA